MPVIQNHQWKPWVDNRDHGKKETNKQSPEDCTICFQCCWLILPMLSCLALHLPKVHGLLGQHELRDHFANGFPMDQFDRWPRSLRSLHSTWRCLLQGGPLHDFLPISIQQTHWSYPISRMARSHITLMINSSATFCFTKQNKAQSLTKTLPGTNSVHLKIGLNAPKRKIIFQPLFFCRSVSFREDKPVICWKFWQNINRLTSLLGAHLWIVLHRSNGKIHIQPKVPLGPVKLRDSRPSIAKH